MEQKQNKIVKNLTNTIAVVGLSVSLLGSTNTYQVHRIGSEEQDFFQKYCGNRSVSSTETGKENVSNANYIVEKKMTPLERETLTLFGVMRDATMEEQIKIQEYVDSISEDTGVNFFDLC